MVYMGVSHHGDITEAGKSKPLDISLKSSKMSWKASPDIG